MSRIPDLVVDKLTPEQREIHDRIIGTRGGVMRGPFVAWIKSPAIAAGVDQLGNAMRLDGKLDKPLFELAVLVVARHWSAQYEWWVHARAAEQCGLDIGIIDAIREHRLPSFTTDKQAVIYEFVSELLETRKVTQASYDRAVAVFGVELLTEIVTTVGFYSMAAMVMNSFDMSVPGGGRPLA